MCVSSVLRFTGGSRATLVGDIGRSHVNEVSCSTPSAIVVYTRFCELNHRWMDSAPCSILHLALPLNQSQPKEWCSLGNTEAVGNHVL